MEDYSPEYYSDDIRKNLGIDDYVGNVIIPTAAGSLVGGLGGGALAGLLEKAILKTPSNAPSRLIAGGVGLGTALSLPLLGRYYHNQRENYITQTGKHVSDAYHHLEGLKQKALAERDARQAAKTAGAFTALRHLGL